MKRIYLGLGILAILLCVALLVSAVMDRLHAPIAQDLQDAALAAKNGDWESAATLAGSAADRWQHCKRFTAALADHSPMDDMEGLFAELEVYLQQREMPHFAATCRHLAYLAGAMGDNHAMSWWNLL